MRHSVAAITFGCVVCALVLVSCRDSSTPKQSGLFVYWDNNEEEDVLLPSGKIEQLVAPWDPNGQMCIFPDQSGRFVVGYNPTLPSQNDPGGACPGGEGACLKPLHNPPIGEAIFDHHGNSSPDATIYVPGPYALPGSIIGGDVPPQNGGPWQSGAFNNDGTYLGCVFDAEAHLFAVDIATAQGSIPIPDDGRLIEWFPPDYKEYCIIYGPNSGGDGAHHVDGSGGLQNPGMLASFQGDIYLPETGAGRVLRFRKDVLPRTAADCGADGLLTPRPTPEVFIQDHSIGFPGAIARDPITNGWAVSNVIGNPAVAWFNDDASPNPAKGPLPSGAYNPFGIAIAPDGDLYFVDVHLTCDANNCGNVANNGAVFKVTFDNGEPATPMVIATGLNFPSSVTLCEGNDCPFPLQ
jgi:hypothetical protein